MGYTEKIIIFVHKFQLNLNKNTEEDGKGNYNGKVMKFKCLHKHR